MAYVRKKAENAIKEKHLKKMRIYLSNIDKLKLNQNESKVKKLN